MHVLLHPQKKKASSEEESSEEESETEESETDDEEAGKKKQKVKTKKKKAKEVVRFACTPTVHLYSADLWDHVSSLSNVPFS